MSRSITIPASESLVQAVVAELESEGNDFSSTLVVFPGKRPAHFVRKALAERVGGSFIPPRIFSIDSFIDFLITDKLGLSATPLGTFDAIALLFEIHGSIRDHLGGPHFTAMDRFIGLGMKLIDELEELVMADATTRRIQEAVAVAPLGRLQALPEYFERFYGAVTARGFTTRALNYRTAAEQIETIDCTSHRRIVLAGFFAYTALERRIVTSLLRRDTTVLIAQRGPGLQRHLQTIGVDAGPEDSTEQAPAPTFHFTKASDTHGQVFALNQKIRERLLSGTPVNERTTIVLPTSDALFPVVHQTLSLLPHDQYNIALGYPLRRTPLFGFLSNLMDVAAGARNGEVPAREYAAFMLHPYTKNIRFGQRSDVTRVLFHAIETHLAEHQSRTFITLDSLESNGRLLEGVVRSLERSGGAVGLSELQEHLKAIHDQTIRRFLHVESVGDLSSRAIEVLQYVYRQSTATRHRFFHPYAQRLIEFLDSIGSSLLAPQQFAEPSGYFAFLRNAVSSEQVPFAGTPLVGLQVLGLLETRSLSFETVYLLNATDDVIPGSRGNDVLLPQPFREKLGLETYRQREQLIEYYFSILLAGARDVHFFFTESGNHEKSRFLEKILWQEQKRTRSLDVRNLIRVIRYNVELSTPKPRPIAKTTAVLDHLREFEYTATALDTYLACQLRFYYAHVLKLSEKDDVAEEIDLLEIGNFVHTVLATFLKPAVGRALTAADFDRERLRALIELLYEQQFGGDPVGPAYLVKHQIAGHLDAYLTGYQIPKIAGEKIKLVGLEQGFSVHTGGHSFAGRIDRIEQRGDRYFILDYKTGRDDSRVRIDIGKLIPDDHSTWRTAIGSFQLPMYVLLFSESRKIPVESISPAYLFLGRNQIDQNIEIGIGGKKNNAQEVFEAVKPVLFGAIGEILDPEKQFEPTDDLNRMCPQCPYAAICGTSWTNM